MIDLQQPVNPTLQLVTNCTYVWLTSAPVCHAESHHNACVLLQCNVTDQLQQQGTLLVDMGASIFLKHLLASSD